MHLDQTQSNNRPAIPYGASRLSTLTLPPDCDVGTLASAFNLLTGDIIFGRELTPGADLWLDMWVEFVTLGRSPVPPPNIGAVAYTVRHRSRSSHAPRWSCPRTSTNITVSVRNTIWYKVDQSHAVAVPALVNYTALSKPTLDGPPVDELEDSVDFYDAAMAWNLDVGDIVLGRNISAKVWEDVELEVVELTTDTNAGGESVPRYMVKRRTRNDSFPDFEECQAELQSTLRLSRAATWFKFNRITASSVIKATLHPPLDGAHIYTASLPTLLHMDELIRRLNLDTGDVLLERAQSTGTMYDYRYEITKLERDKSGSITAYRVRRHTRRTGDGQWSRTGDWSQEYVTDDMQLNMHTAEWSLLSAARTAASTPNSAAAVAPPLPTAYAELPKPNAAQSVSQVVRGWNLVVGDAVLERGEGPGWWNDAHLTLNYIGNEVCVWTMKQRSHTSINWSTPTEAIVAMNRNYRWFKYTEAQLPALEAGEVVLATLDRVKQPDAEEVVKNVLTAFASSRGKVLRGARQGDGLRFQCWLSKAIDPLGREVWFVATRHSGSPEWAVDPVTDVSSHISSYHRWSTIPVPAPVLIPKDDPATQQIAKLSKLLWDVGVCAVCGKEREHECSEPFSHCGCGTSEDQSGPGTIQELREKLGRAERLNHNPTAFDYVGQHVEDGTYGVVGSVKIYDKDLRKGLLRVKSGMFIDSGEARPLTTLHGMQLYAVPHATKGLA